MHGGDLQSHHHQRKAKKAHPLHLPLPLPYLSLHLLLSTLMLLLFSSLRGCHAWQHHLLRPRTLAAASPRSSSLLTTTTTTHLFSSRASQSQYPSFRPGDGSEGIEAHKQAMENFELQILHEDKDIIVVTKPPGALCVPGRFIKDSLVVRVAAHFKIHDYARMVVHRLDQGTSGVLVFARNEASLRDLHAQLRPEAKEAEGGTGGMQKRYVALVEGADIEPTSGHIALPLRKDMDNPPKQMVDLKEGKPSRTEYVVRKRGADRALVELTPVTGRTHQLRVHMSCIGHPILGDIFYAPQRVQDKAPGQRLCLHAEALAFIHPGTKEHVRFVSEYPAEWDEGLLE